MAKTVYVNGYTGNDSWDGLSRAYVSGTNGPKKTVPGGRAVTVNGDLVLIAPGVYPSGYLYFNSGSLDNGTMYRRDPAYPGRTIIDFQNVSGAFWDTYWQFPTYFVDLHFRNPAPVGVLFRCNDGNSRFYHCVFYDREGSAATSDTRGLQKFNSGGNDIALVNCTFYNLTYGVVDLTLNPAYNNYFVGVTTPFYSPAGTRDYNAYPGNTETYGINTSSGANPGLIDPSNGDFSLDPTTLADWQTFMSSGYFGGRIGAMSRGGVYYNPDVPQLGFLTQVPTYAQGNPNPGWENEGPNGTNTYTAGTPGDIIEVTGGFLEIDLTTTPAATGGRVRSEVFDRGGTGGLLRGISWAGAENPGVGAALDIDTTFPLQQEYRSSATSFAKGDVSPSWTAFAKSTNIAQTGHRYVQLRVTLRTDHTNA